MENKHKNAVIVVLFAIVIIMAVGFAGFTQQLTIKDTASVSSNWNVGFLSATADTTCDKNANKCGDVSTTVDTTNGTTKALTFSTKLASPSDTVTYTVKVKNFGTVDAKLVNVNLAETDSSNLIEYSYDTNALAAGTTTLAAGAEMTFTVTVTFAQTTGTIATKSDGATLTLDWEQA
jgi:uncharacterized repeat protein (TIGR01451 family)